jgi:hypothetical protein
MANKVTLTAVQVVLGVCLCLLPTAAAADTRSGHGHSTYGRSHVRVYSGGWYSSWYSPWYSPFYGGYAGYYSAYPGYYYGRAYLPDVSFIDTDIQPEKTEVYLDGDYAGTVDDFDGFPQYLAIRPGRHMLTFKADGYKTVTKSVRVARGAVLQMDFSLTEGSGEEPVPGKKEEEGIAASDPDARAESGEVRGRVEMAEAENSQEAGPGLIRLRVAPADASVYLDGEFIGTASRVSRLHGDLRLAPGEHRIEVVRPGYRAISRTVEVVAGDRLTLDLDLEKNQAEPDPR